MTKNKTNGGRQQRLPVINQRKQQNDAASTRIKSASHKTMKNTIDSKQDPTIQINIKDKSVVREIVKGVQSILNTEVPARILLRLEIDAARTKGFSPEPYFSAAEELALIFKYDRSAEEALLKKVFNNSEVDQLAFGRALKKLGALGPHVPHPTINGLTVPIFDARPLIEMLKKMRDREPLTGLAKSCPKATQQRFRWERVKARHQQHELRDVKGRSTSSTPQKTATDKTALSVSPLLNTTLNMTTNNQSGKTVKNCPRSLKTLLKLTEVVPITPGEKYTAVGILKLLVDHARKMGFSKAELELYKAYLRKGRSLPSF